VVTFPANAHLEAHCTNQGSVGNTSSIGVASEKCVENMRMFEGKSVAGEGDRLCFPVYLLAGTQEAKI